MDYVRAIASTIFLSIPFVIVLDIAFNVLQIPFAIIHRYAARLVFVYKMYLLSQFYAILTRFHVESQNLLPIVLLIANSLIIYFVISSAVSSAKRNDYEQGMDNATFVGIVSLASIPSLWIVYYLNITLFVQPIAWFARLLDFAYDIPIIGNILAFFTRASAGWALLCIGIAVLGAIIFLIGKISDRR